MSFGDPLDCQLHGAVHPDFEVPKCFQLPLGIEQVEPFHDHILGFVVDDDDILFRIFKAVVETWEGALPVFLELLELLPESVAVEGEGRSPPSNSLLAEVPAVKVEPIHGDHTRVLERGVQFRRRRRFSGARDACYRDKIGLLRVDQLDQLPTGRVLQAEYK